MSTAAALRAKKEAPLAEIRGAVADEPRPRTAEEFDRALQMAGSERRCPILLDALESDLDAADKRQLVEEWWTTSEGWGDDLNAALAALAALRDEFREPLGSPLPLKGRLTVYRATAGEQPDGGSWTLDREVAVRMAAMLSSWRGAFLYGRAVSDPVIWRGEVEAGDVLAQFTDRDEAEVVLSHGVVSAVEMLPDEAEA